MEFKGVSIECQVLRHRDCVEQVCDQGRNWLYDGNLSYVPGYATDRCSKKVTGMCC